jgi:hypothetical protein
MTARETWAFAPMIAMILLGLAVVVPMVGTAEAESPVPEAEDPVDPWDYLDGRHTSPAGSEALVWDRAAGRWSWTMSKAGRAHVVLIAEYAAGTRAEVFARGYGDGLGMNKCLGMVDWLEINEGVEARCLVLGLDS